ncbi:hypothetical protein [Rhodococcus jostii]|uniref:hypothetical protein n=1 Tax=Rhodococcus jostii TaxID=132919 RepID=UPI0036269FA9
MGARRAPFAQPCRPRKPPRLVGLDLSATLLRGHPPRSCGPSLPNCPVAGPAGDSFDAADAPDLLAKVVDAVTVDPWDAPLVALPDPRLPHRAASTRPSSPPRRPRAMPIPLFVTKRGALLVARRHAVGR